MRHHQHRQRCCSSVAAGCTVNSSAHSLPHPSAGMSWTVSADCLVAAVAATGVAAALAQPPKLTVAAAPTQTQHPSATRQHSTSKGFREARYTPDPSEGCLYLVTNIATKQCQCPPCNAANNQFFFHTSTDLLQTPIMEGKARQQHSYKHYCALNCWHKHSL